MPLALLFRLLSRVLIVLGVVVFRRRVRRGVPVPPPYRTPGMDRPGPLDWRQLLGSRRWLGRRLARVEGITAGARMAGIALTFAAFASAALVLLSAGTTLTTLGPRWVGIVLLVLAAGFGLAAVREAVWLRRLAVQRQRRRRLRLPGPEE